METVPPEPPESLDDLIRRASGGAPVTLAVVGADGATALDASLRAAGDGLVEPVLFGDPDRIRAAADARGLEVGSATLVGTGEPAARAAAMAGAGEVDVLLKGSVRSDQLLRAVLDREHGLRTDRLLSDVLLYEDVLSDTRRVVGITDGGVNVAPDADHLRQIVLNAVEVLHALGWEEPRVAVLSATEAVSESVPSTVLARSLQHAAEAGEVPGCVVQGPLALDNALLVSAAEAKGIEGPVAGRADLLVTTSIEAGNLLGKAVKYFGGSVTGHVVTGARVPVLIPSRVESVEDKMTSIALGVLVAGRRS